KALAAAMSANCTSPVYCSTSGSSLSAYIMGPSSARKGRMKSRSVVNSMAFFVDCLIVFNGWKWIIIAVQQVLPPDVFGRRSKADGMILQRFPIYQQDVFYSISQLPESLGVF